MTHPKLNPKLPPKWKWKRVELLLGDLPRSYVAAIIEIEWRKRAAEICARQDVVFTDLWNLIKRRRIPKWRETQEAKYKKLQTEEARCYEIAKAWREWGKE